MPDSYMVGNAPYGGSYTPPRLDTSWLGDLPQTYYQGAQARRQNALATAFQNPDEYKNADGSYDFGKMTDKILSIAGPQAAGPMIQQMLTQQLGMQAGREFMGGGDLPGPSPRAAAPQQQQTWGNRGPTGPDNLRPVPPDNAHNMESDTITSLVAGHFQNQDMPGLIRALKAKYFPGDPNGANQNLNADQTSQIVEDIEGVKAQRAQQAQQAQPQSGAQPTAQGGVPTQAPQAGAAGPTPGPGPAPSGPYAQTAGATGGPAMPPEYSDATLNNLKFAQRRNQAMAAYAASVKNPELSAVYKQRADELDNRIKAIEEYRSKAQMPTEKQKESAQVGLNPRSLALAQDADKVRFASGQKTYLALRQAESDSLANQHYIDAGRAALNDPKYYGGIGSNTAMVVQKLKAAIGLDPNAALANELLTKTTSQSVLNQVSQFKDNMAEMGSQTGRIFQSQIELMLKSSASNEGTIPGSLALLEIQERAGKYQQKFAQMARDYLAAKKKAGDPTPYLDEDFDQQTSNYLQQHPMFKPEELKDLRLLGARTFNSPDKAAATLGEGQPYKNSKGQYVISRKRQPNG